MYHKNANHKKRQCGQIRWGEIDFWTREITSNKKEHCLMIKQLIPPWATTMLNSYISNNRASKHRKQIVRTKGRDGAIHNHSCEF